MSCFQNPNIHSYSYSVVQDLMLGNFLRVFFSETFKRNVGVVGIGGYVPSHPQILRAGAGVAGGLLIIVPSFLEGDVRWPHLS